MTPQHPRLHATHRPVVDPRRLSTTGAVVGALAGAVTRGGLVLVHLDELTGATGLLVLTAAIVGGFIGVLAGMTGRPVSGTLIGAIVSGVMFLVTLPAAAVMSFLGAGTMARLLEVVGAGALAGLIGGAAGPRARRHRGR